MTTRVTLENSVISAISKVLGLPSGKVGLADDFNNLGGNSLKAAQLAATLQVIYPGLKITAEEVLRCRTASGLADFIRRQGLG